METVYDIVQMFALVIGVRLFFRIVKYWVAILRSN